jgi:hypothetical protein
MECNQCGQAGSVVCRVIKEPIDFLPFSDEEGKIHLHDPNVKVLDWACPKDHAWTEHRMHLCPSCHYGAMSGVVAIEEDEVAEEE